MNYFLFADDGSILVVAHASSLDTCSRQLTGFEPRSEEAMTKIQSKVPYCSVVRLQSNNTLWRIIDSPVPSICHSLNKRFDYKILINTEEWKTFILSFSRENENRICVRPFYYFLFISNQSRVRNFDSSIIFNIVICKLSPIFHLVGAKWRRFIIFSEN